MPYVSKRGKWSLQRFGKFPWPRTQPIWKTGELEKLTIKNKLKYFLSSSQTGTL